MIIGRTIFKIYLCIMLLEFKNSTIHFTVTGKGKTVVLLHGFLETLHMWQTLVPELSKTHHVICIDLLGHGKTDCLSYVHTMDDMAKGILTVLYHLEVKSAYFIGHSMGGYTALALAEKAPQLIKGLCLMNSTYEADDEERKELRTRAIEMAKTNYKSLVRMSFANLFTTASKLKFLSEYDAALQLALQIPLQSFIAAQEGMKLRPNRFEVFKNLKASKLIILGKKDSLIHSNKIATQIKNTAIDFEELSEGHMSHIENKSELSYLLKRFI